MRTPSSSLRRFLKNDGGSVIAEGVLVLPALLWALLALYVFWDSYRAINTVQKASYTISDMISRRRDEVDPAFITGLRDVMDYLLDPDQSARVRVTSLTWDQTDNRYEVLWSCSPDSALAQRTTASLIAVTNRLPIMSNGDSVVLVESEVDYVPAFDMGLNETTLRQFIVTRPRFMPTVGLNGAC